VPDGNAAFFHAQGKFNTFQQTMLQWDSMYPYNAVHIVRIPGAPDLERLRCAVNGTLESRGLTGLTLNYDQGTYCYGGSAACCEISNLDCAGSPRASLTTEIERQLNTPFVQARPFSPFRFFVASGEDSFSLGLAYLHAIADAESIVLLLKEIVGNFTGRDGQGHSTAAGVGPPQHTNPLISYPGAFARKLGSLPSLIRDMRSSCRPPYRDANDLNNGFALFSLKPPSLNCLLEAGRAWGTTVNDLLLALLMKSCAMLAANRKRTGRRKDISVGCIVNTRKDFKVEDRGAFGLFLGSFVITHAVPEELSLAGLAKEIGRKTLEIKRKKLYLATPLELAFGRFMFCFFSNERRKKLYQKHYPLWGGLTNMNINSLWQPRDRDNSIDYIRAVSTGPTTPLVLSFTTAGQGANIGLSYRSTVISADDIERLTACFMRNLAELEVSA
jgi:NRPS condensation-like uncharacterized protein